MSNPKTDKKIAISLFVSSIICLIAVLLFSDDIYLTDKEPATSQNRKWTLPTDNIDMASISEIQLIAPKEQHINIGIAIENREDISVVHSNCNDNCDKQFNINKLQSSIENNTLTLDFTQTVIKEEGYATVVIKLPSKDWQISCDKKHTFDCETVTNHSAPINFTLIADADVYVKGNFKQLTIWKLSRQHYQEQRILSGKIDTFSVYGNTVNIDFYKTDIKKINLHSSAEGRFRTNNLALLQRTTWQPLTEAEQTKLETLSEQN